MLGGSRLALDEELVLRIAFSQPVAGQLTLWVVGCSARAGRRLERREYVMVEDTGNPRPITRGPWFDCDRDVNEKAGFPREERCHNVAKTGVDSRGLQKTEGHDHAAGT